MLTVLSKPGWERVSTFHGVNYSETMISLLRNDSSLLALSLPVQLLSSWTPPLVSWVLTALSQLLLLLCFSVYIHTHWRYAQIEPWFNWLLNYKHYTSSSIVILWTWITWRECVFTYNSGVHHGELLCLTLYLSCSFLQSTGETVNILILIMVDPHLRLLFLLELFLLFLRLLHSL